MYPSNNVSCAMAIAALSTTLLINPSIAKTTSNDNIITATNPNDTAKDKANKDSDIKKDATKEETTKQNSPIARGISQKIVRDTKTASLLNELLPTIRYTTNNLSAIAQKVNNSTWSQDDNTDYKTDRTIGTKLQALLNWHNNGVGAVDGYWGKNTRKAMQAFQKSRGLTITEQLNNATWQALIANNKLAAQPVLVNYKLQNADVEIKTITIPASTEAKSKLDKMYYESVTEALAEKFHMSEKYLKALNPNAVFSAGETITVYNPGNPNTKQVTRVVADKTTETLYAYDNNNNLVASYPTTVGSTATPSPSGTHKVEVKVHNPNYTYTGNDGSQLIIPPGPNNPVGVVWIGLSKPSYGIHGSPDPARISRQASSGCVRLTNWDALALLGTIKNGATVEFR